MKNTFATSIGLFAKRMLWDSFWGCYQLGAIRWDTPMGKGPQIFTETNARAYAHFLGERYREADLVWIIGGDRTVDDRDEIEILRALSARFRTGVTGKQ